tara:strand:- start:10472 stop:10801 length:330 start_codon:yes stop_codon:yes gene_type:complete
MILHRWEKCLNNGNSLDDIVSLYNKESTLISTFEGIFINDKEGIKQYFKKLADKNCKIKIITNNIMKIDANYLEFGIYEFKTDTNSIKARFSMISDGNTIVHHHSSECN